MVDLSMVMTVVGPSAGGFLGSWISFYIYCPNHRCCQMKTVHRILENRDKE